MDLLREASKLSDKRIVRMREKWELIPNEDKGAIFEPANVAEELGVSEEGFETLLKILGAGAIEALTKGHAPAKSITEGLIVQGLLIGQELAKLQANNDEGRME